ncbi:hypothetical protein GONAM_10_00465 [Gordonia namibiensis NBRC 108229]|uniref:Uncharacterized protein n=1 Tax=Gordonia namibiensis NBRC 108229 TaxID=1208314 RepID=K6WJN8_9ACTN|nr:hypothetical protein GONAM_10_00465 [Gordonia namibiensis NBRC 108229]
MALLSRPETNDDRYGRLATDDAPFWFATPALGWSVVLQLVWVFDEEVSLEAMTSMNAALARGRMHRMLVPSTVYGSRPSWGPAPDAPGLAVDSLPVPDAGVDAWAIAEMSTVPLDAEGGRCWRLRCAPTESGGTVLSLSALHVVTDGRGMVAAAAEAARESGVPVAVAADRTPSSASSESFVPLRRRRLADAADAVAQAGAVVAGIVRAVAERRKASWPGTGSATGTPSARRAIPGGQVHLGDRVDPRGRLGPRRNRARRNPEHPLHRGGERAPPVERTIPVGHPDQGRRPGGSSCGRGGQPDQRDRGGLGVPHRRAGAGRRSHRDPGRVQGRLRAAVRRASRTPHPSTPARLVPAAVGADQARGRRRGQGHARRGDLQHR